VVCHVLHLVDPWQRVIDELVRVVRPGGVILIESSERSTSASADAGREVSQRFWAETSLGSRPVVGLRDGSLLGPMMGELGFTRRVLPAIVERVERDLGEIIGRLEDGILSGCWDLSAEERRTAAAATREWARERFGPLDRPYALEQTITWHAYDAPGSA
jgi:SAM-dependent methyltransferase